MDIQSPPPTEDHRHCRTYRKPEEGGGRKTCHPTGTPVRKLGRSNEQRQDRRCRHHLHAGSTAYPARRSKRWNMDTMYCLKNPMAHRQEDCVTLVQAAEKHGRLLQIAHVLRYTDFFQSIYQIVQSGRLGKIITVSHRENVSAWHMAHSYVRGNWRREDQSSPMLLAKSCHDLDILYWILGSKARTLSSVGNLMLFKAGKRSAGCPASLPGWLPGIRNLPLLRTHHLYGY